MKMLEQITLSRQDRTTCHLRRDLRIKITPHIKKVKHPAKKTTEETKTVSFLPGVIRHTSCPNSALAYYYDYNAYSK